MAYLRAQHGHVIILSSLIGSANIPVGATDWCPESPDPLSTCWWWINLALRNRGLVYDLRDRLVCSINNDHIQQKLLSEVKELTLKSAMKLAQAMEAAVKDSVELKPQVPQPTIQKLMKRKSRARNLAIVQEWDKHHTNVDSRTRCVISAEK